jgi:hypothetical protein
VRMRTGVAVWLALCLGALGAAVSAQSLEDAAARERQKREKGTTQEPKPQPKVYTNDDLPQGTSGSPEANQGTAATPAGNTPSSAESGAPQNRRRPPAPEGPQTGGKGDEDVTSSLTAEAKAAAQQLKSLEGTIDTLKSKLNPMSLSFIFGPGGSGSAEEELQVRDELTKAEAALPAARARLERAEADVREGRRSPRPAVAPD